jgi:hypothetical protein
MTTSFQKIFQRKGGEIKYLYDQIKALKSSTPAKTDVYTKTESDTLLNTKANSTEVYNKTEVDTSLGLKANTSDVYTKTEVDALLAGKQDRA